MKNSEFHQEKVVFFNPFEINESIRFDPQAKARVDLADIHSRATKVGIVSKNQQKKKFCVCCGSSHNKEDFKILCNIDDFLSYGPTITIAFKFIKYCAVTIFILFLITNIFIYYFSNEVWFCQRYYCNIEKLQRQVQENYIYLKINHIIMIFVTILLKNFLSHKVSTYEKKLEENYPNIESYSIELKHLQKDLQDLDIKKQLEEHNVTVEKINKVYDIRELTTLLKQYQSSNKMFLIKKFSEKFKKQNKEDRQKLIDQIKQKAIHFCKNKQDYFIGVAFVTLSTKQDVQKFIKNSSMRVMHRTKKVKNFHIKKASSPDDILWTNYGFSKFQKLTRRFLTFFVAIVTTFLFFVVVYYIQRHQQQLEKKDKGKSINLMSLLISIVVTALNISLVEFFEILTPSERRTTSSSQKNSDIWKITIFMVLNVTVFLLIVQHTYNKFKIFGNGGLLNTVQYILIIATVQSIFMKLLEPNYWLRLYRINYLKKRLKKNPESVTQLELNEAKEHLVFMVQYAYSGTMKSYCVALFYQPIFPLACLLSAIELFFSYWILKYSFIYRSKDPQNLNFSFTLNSLSCFNFVLIFTAFSGLIWEILIFQKLSLTQIIIIVIVVIETLIFSINNLIQLFLHKKHQNKTSYKDNKDYFAYEYDRMNPVTKSKAFQTWMKENKLQQGDIDNNEWEDLVANIYDTIQKQQDYRIQLMFSSQNPFKKDQSVQSIIQQSYLQQQFGQNLNQVFKKIIQDGNDYSKQEKHKNKIYQSLEDQDSEDSYKDFKDYGKHLKKKTIDQFKESLTSSKIN